MEIKCFAEGAIRTNTYVVYEVDGSCFIVDPAVDYAPLDEFLVSMNLSPSYIILTHGHGDHTEGIPGLKAKYPGCKLIASEKEREFLQEKGKRYGKISITADIWSKDGDEMEIGSLHVKFISTPGHTPGGQCIYCDGKLFSGDTLFHCSVGRSDLFGGNEQKLLECVKTKLFSLPDDTEVYPGHMGMTNIGYEKRNNPFV